MAVEVNLSFIFRAVFEFSRLGNENFALQINFSTHHLMSDIVRYVISRDNITSRIGLKLLPPPCTFPPPPATFALA